MSEQNKKSIVVYNLGRRFEPNAKPTRTIYDKLARRMLRRRWKAQSSRIEKALASCREEDLEIARLATNSHQRLRAIAQDRKERAAA